VKDVADLYDDDFYQWTQQQATAIRAGNWEAIDRKHLAEEVEDWWKTDSARLRQALQDICVWLLAYTYAPEQRQAHYSWYVRITSLRVDLEVITDIWSNLAVRAQDMLPKAYARSREQAPQESGLPLETFPETCPWTLEQVLNGSLEGPHSPFGKDPRFPEE
jgi:Domain of unknown function DUF29